MPIWDADIIGHTKVNHCVTAPACPYFTMSCFLFDLLADNLGAEACVYRIIHLRYLSQKPHGWITHATVNTSPGSSRYQTSRPKHPQSSCIIQLFGEESPGGTIICVITQERNIEKKKILSPHHHFAKRVFKDQLLSPCWLTCSCPPAAGVHPVSSGAAGLNCKRWEIRKLQSLALSSELLARLKAISYSCSTGQG